MKTSNFQVISFGALVALIGFITSGPVGFLIVNMVHPQPPWISSAVFVSNYSSLQDLPFYFGFMLVGGMLMLSAGHYLNSEEVPRKKFCLLLSVASAIIFATLVSFNYICQTTFVHNLALHYKPEYDTAIATFSMSNPLSFCWANEMWGYGFLGVSTWLMTVYYSASRTIRLLLVLNGLVSLLSVIYTIIDINWVMTIGGLVAYFSWNVLMIVLMILIYQHSKKT